MKYFSKVNTEKQIIQSLVFYLKNDMIILVPKIRTNKEFRRFEMIIMKIKLNNFLLFNDFEINMSYPKKIVGSSIENEHLKDHPNFRYKKLIILMGANSTGKTALGRVINGILNFINKKEYSSIVGLIEDNKKSSYFEIDFVTEDNRLFKISSSIDPISFHNPSYESDNFHVSVKFANINKYDSYETCSGRLDKMLDESCKNYIAELEKIPTLSWMFEYPFSVDGKQHKIKPVDSDLYLLYLKNILQILDPRIVDVFNVSDATNTYLIQLNKTPVVLADGELVSPEKLSSGTQDGIGVANILSSIKLHSYGFYYCDEKFSHIHSELEKAFLSLMVEYLGSNEQLFFTTHNSDILEMNFPKHSYAFLRRDEYNDNAISCVYASEYIKKNDVSLKLAVENDIFSANPDASKIFSIFQTNGNDNEE